MSTISAATRSHAARDGSSPDRSGGLRTDIQGLRAVAVSIVVVYHLSARWLGGGFVGVDVFFVISGFLITSHLLGSPPRGPRDLATFWSRRIRRLLPASLLVLTATLVASRLVAPDTQWEGTARQVRAAALYVVNWLLAHDAVDYLAAENAATPVQHFWSLSVEEQFYFVWPIAILLLALLARALRRRAAPVVGLGLAVIAAASLAYSVTETASNPAAAYFITPTRMWELAAGGLLAVATAPRALGRDDRPRVPPAGIALVLGWGGLAAIAWSAWTYTGRTPFPGYQALVPVIGTVMVIAAHPRASDRSTPGPLLALRPVQWLGDVSYSVYLWHWPMVVLVPYVSGGHLGNLDRLAIVVATLVLAGLTKRFVEDRFRKPRWGRPLRKPYVLGALGMAVVVGLCSLQLLEVRHDRADAQQALARAVSGNDPCFGARALDPGRDCAAVPYDHLLPASVDAASDKADAYADVGGTDCWSYLPHYPTKRCSFGDHRSSVHIALVGNSHAGQWLPALEALAERHHWRIDTYLASRCALADVAQDFDTAANSKACSAWTDRTVRRVVADRPDLVVVSNRISVAAVGHTYAGSTAAYRDGYLSVLRRFGDAGAKVLVLRDTPAPGASIPDCVAQQGQDYARCDGSREDWLPPEPAVTAVRQVDDPGIAAVDLTDHICDGPTCHAVTGGVITYFDGSHMTATFARTLAPYLDEPVRRLLNR
ncbi:MAG: acyltransferase family protein [Marmoricola sp.]